MLSYVIYTIYLVQLNAYGFNSTPWYVREFSGMSIIILFSR